MTIAYWCVLAMIIFPYFFTALAKISAHYDNHDPRNYSLNLTGWRKRAYHIQLNSFEITPAFGIAVIIANQMHANQSSITMLAVLFVASRVCYAICYLMDQAELRSLFWGIGAACMMGLFFLPVKLVT